ncbi:DUF4352 domain-containing protein [Salsuginibacillus kocurii]|uniref:DUF4352 domain-containing protein n=1 Tax=Salsuginibacillus kocurii TaxID=427078 RepID=UPI0003631BB5|nr:DUF4352 domain-containing protein [Salsuginibacillus kocurii]
MGKFFKGCLTIIGIFFVLLVIIAIIGGGDDEEETATEPEDEPVEEQDENGEEVDEEGTEEDAPEEETEEELEEELFSVGDTVEHNDYALTVNEVETSSGTEFESPGEGNEYVIVHVTIDNDGEDQISYNPYHFSIQDSNGNITDQAFTTVDSDTSLSSGDLAPGGTVSGTIAFEAPADDPELELIFEPSFWSADEVRVNLNQ